MWEAMEDGLARGHLETVFWVLYDASSTCFEGRRRPLARRGDSRDGERGKLRIVFGFLRNREGAGPAHRSEKTRSRWGWSGSASCGDRLCASWPRQGPCDLAEITDTETDPGEGLAVCRNPVLAAERERKREERLQALACGGGRAGG